MKQSAVFKFGMFTMFSKNPFFRVHFEFGFIALIDSMGEVPNFQNPELSKLHSCTRRPLNIHNFKFKWSNVLSQTENKSEKLFQHFEADFLRKVSLKILNSGIILKTFTHEIHSW